MYIVVERRVDSSYNNHIYTAVFETWHAARHHVALQMKNDMGSAVEEGWEEDEIEKFYDDSTGCYGSWTEKFEYYYYITQPLSE